MKEGNIIEEVPLYGLVWLKNKQKRTSRDGIDAVALS